MVSVMNSINDLQSRFGSENVSFYAGPGGMTAVKLANASGEATLTLYGAHVMSYTPAGALPVLWMSEKSMFSDGDPIRGGIPVCWPWFGPDVTGKFGGHGYARVSLWKMVSAEQTPDGETRVTLALTDADVDAKFAPQPFKLEFTVTLGASLTVALKVSNTGSKALAYSGALHSYFNVADSAAIKVNGLEDCEYADKVLNVVAPMDLRIERVVKRDNVTVEQVLDRMSKQWSDQQRATYSDFTIFADSKRAVLPQILNVIKEMNLL